MLYSCGETHAREKTKVEKTCRAWRETERPSASCERPRSPPGCGKGTRGSPGARSRHSGEARRGVPRGHLRARTSDPFSTVGGDNPLGTVHRYTRESSDADSIPEISYARILRLCQPARTAAGYSLHRLLPQQDEVHHRREQENHRRVRRKRAAR